jgi:hypothetical protein
VPAATVRAGPEIVTAISTAATVEAFALRIDIVFSKM